jgi:hypothetical protein
MIESARPAADMPVMPRQDEQLLSLPGTGEPQTVYISILSGGTTPSVGFSLTPSSQAFPDGMIWPCNREYALLLNFVFLPSTIGTICEVVSDQLGFWVAKPIVPPPGGINQQACTQNVVDVYRFHVDVHINGITHRVDPRIVVTPLM